MKIPPGVLTEPLAGLSKGGQSIYCNSNTSQLIIQYSVFDLYRSSQLTLF